VRIRLAVTVAAAVATLAQIALSKSLAADRTIQTCRGPETVVAPNQTFPLTCNVTSPLGGAQMVVLPEMWVPGNGCIVTTDKPRVVIVGNNFGVSATFRNRCGSSYKGSEGGLAWEIVRIAP
jgi:hypothetical protein